MQAEYRQRREQLMAKIGNGTAIFGSAPMATMHNDVEYVYRQESDFYYLTGFNEPHAVAVIAPHHEEHKFILFVQPKERDKEIWTGYRVGVDAAKEKYGADEAYLISELDEKLPQYLEKGDKIYYHMGRDENLNNKVITHWQRLLRSYGKRGTGPVSIEDPFLNLHPLRQVKSPAELDLMREAARIAALAHERARHIAKPGVKESEIEAEIEYIFRKNGAMGVAYPSIVASGSNACILHYIDNNSTLQDGDLLLIDAGCSVGYYNSDVTRTFPVNGKFTTEQKIIYELVLDAQMASIEQVKPGTTWKDFHHTSVQIITEGLVQLELLSGDVDTLIEEGKYKNFYMHGTGHWLGLDVHDAGIYMHGAETWYQFQPGNIITVEPGIYISPDIEPAEGQPKIDDCWKGIGVRIEDDVLITPTGNEVLTAAIPKFVEDLESH
ncbi:aminopeptidase P N-terminal domain-containing protein [Chamaesiphon polymorphus]|uniref:Xaa-Pro aminopeptidase n=1 Tax=Chamaesiphon polymorphus CCALA 037 TaxID=2107692 RepID=A0A2T1GE91_9CYAN|nr:aminopeptidase P N-terminal domain-containing protein [Chamaesiphon polymorphus]PSB55854.1 Xaa-Pro aminopeptidase [Chamaesiphon polymorphus CCALA 037]